MMNSRPSLRHKGFDFGSDDVLCPYTDIDPCHPPAPPPLIKSHRESGAGRSTADDVDGEGGCKSEVISTVEKAMEKYSDKLLSFLVGFSGRLSQLESFSCNLERDINELHSDSAHKHNEENLTFIDLVKHLQDVQKSVQIMRDKQELAETQKELAKLQAVQEDCLDIKNTDTKLESSVVVPEITKPEKLPETHTSSLPSQPTPMVSLPSSGDDQNIPSRQAQFQPPPSSTFLLGKTLVEFQQPANTNPQLAFYTQSQTVVPHRNQHYQTMEKLMPSAIQNPQVSQPMYNEPNSFPIPYHPQKQHWPSPSPQTPFSQPREQMVVRTEMPMPQSAPLYSYHLSSAQHPNSSFLQQGFPQHLLQQSSVISQPRAGSQTDESSGRNSSYTNYRYQNVNTSSICQEQK